MKLWRGPPDHDHWRTPFTPKEKAYWWWGLSAVALISAVIKLIYPEKPPFSRKLLIGSIETWAFNHFGSAGVAGAWLMFSIAMLLAGIFVWRRAD